MRTGCGGGREFMGRVNSRAWADAPPRSRTNSTPEEVKETLGVGVCRRKSKKTACGTKPPTRRRRLGCSVVVWRACVRCESSVKRTSCLTRLWQRTNNTQTHATAQGHRTQPSCCCLRIRHDHAFRRPSPFPGGLCFLFYRRCAVRFAS